VIDKLAANCPIHNRGLPGLGSRSAKIRKGFMNSKVWGGRRKKGPVRFSGLPAEGAHRIAQGFAEGRDSHHSCENRTRIAKVLRSQSRRWPLCPDIRPPQQRLDSPRSATARSLAGPFQLSLAEPKGCHRKPPAHHKSQVIRSMVEQGKIRSQRNHPPGFFSGAFFKTSTGNGYRP